SKLPPYQFTYKHDVFDQKRISASWFSSSVNYIDILFADLNGDRIDDVAFRDSYEKYIDRDTDQTICFTARSDQGGRSTTKCSASSRYWIHAPRRGLTKYKDPKHSYRYERCRTSGSGEYDICDTYDTTDGLYDDTTRIGDFDGDGQDDVIASRKQYFSKAADQSWSNAKGKHVADFNSDGLSDLAEVTSRVSARLSNGKSGFISTFTSPSLSTALFADFNGDGLTDFIYKKGKYDYKIYYSSGLRFLSGATVNVSDFKYIYADSIHAADVNGDGRADFIGNRKRDHTRLYLTRGETLVLKPSASSSDLLRDYTTAFMSDVDGDGISEFVTNRRKYSSGFDGRATKLVSERPDMLVGVVLPSGGHLSASYTTYGGDTDDERWFPPVLTVLASLTEKPNSSQ
ncbi:FG-GAP repeat domain-containing protein, partial [Pseudovibrio denitrificans]